MSHVRLIGVILKEWKDRQELEWINFVRSDIDVEEVDYECRPNRVYSSWTFQVQFRGCSFQFEVDHFRNSRIEGSD